MGLAPEGRGGEVRSGGAAAAFTKHVLSVLLVNSLTEVDHAEARAKAREDLKRALGPASRVAIGSQVVRTQSDLTNGPRLRVALNPEPFADLQVRIG